jgi:DNA polymerase III epsilon subunit-like protein
MTKIIFLDTETTGLPKDSSKSAIDISDNWPDIVSICWIIYNGRDRERKEVHIIRPDGFIIPHESIKIHGISQVMAERDGKSLKDVLMSFLYDVRDAHLVIAHNMEFDRNVLFHSFKWRLGINPIEFWPFEAEFCSMKESIDELCIPSKKKGAKGYKNPSLMELYINQFSDLFKGAHTADGDVEALIEIVWARWNLHGVDGNIL